jgi:hypothetical protein
MLFRSPQANNHHKNESKHFHQLLHPQEMRKRKKNQVLLKKGNKEQIKKLFKVREFLTKFLLNKN